jgi:hypothetical protein
MSSGRERRKGMTDNTMPDPEILRATSDQLLIAIEETAVLERRKRGMPPSDPLFPGLALEVRRAAERVLLLARQEEIVARETNEQPASTALPPIERISPAKELAGILEEWRAVEHRLAEAAPGSDEALELLRQFDKLREHYARVLRERQEADSRQEGG